MKFFHPELLIMYVAKFINFLYDFWTFLEKLYSFQDCIFNLLEGWRVWNALLKSMKLIF